MTETDATYTTGDAYDLALKLAETAERVAASLAEFPDDPSASAELVQALGDAEHALDRALGLTDEQQIPRRGEDVPDGLETDLEIARRVMRHDVQPNPLTMRGWDIVIPGSGRYDVPYYSRREDAAWPILDRFWGVTIAKCDGVIPTYTVTIHGRDGSGYEGQAETFPLALCRAALATVQEKGRGQ